jgi:hypothetical protein
MRSARFSAVLRGGVALVLVAPLVWVGVRLWGPSEKHIADFVRIGNPEDPTAVYRADYGQFHYFTYASVFYGNRSPNSGSANGKPGRVVVHRQVHWVALLNTLLCTAISVVTSVWAVLWAVRNRSRRKLVGSHRG